MLARILLISGLVLGHQARGADKLLNVSFDVSRELFTQINQAFVPYYRDQTGRTLEILQSHAGSSKQARSVIDGVDADILSMNTVTDVDLVARRGLLFPAHWRSIRTNHSAPYTSVVVFVVRKGNPKGIGDWKDLVQQGVRIAVANPKTSGNGRYAYLGAWGSALTASNRDEAVARDFIRRFYQNVPVLTTGSRDAAAAFVQRGIGDVLVTIESEFALLQKEYPKQALELVRPQITVEVEMPVVVVERIARKHKLLDAANAYVDFLESPAGQRIIAQNHYRPRNPAILSEFKTQFPEVKSLRIDEDLGGWDGVHAKHFAEDGIFDQIREPRR